MSSGDPSTYYGKPNSDKGQDVSSFPIGIAGLPTEPYDYYEGIGGEGEMGWFKFIAILIAGGAFLAFIIYIYMWYSKISRVGAIAGAVANAAGVKT